MKRIFLSLLPIGCAAFSLLCAPLSAPPAHAAPPAKKTTKTTKKRVVKKTNSVAPKPAPKPTPKPVSKPTPAPVAPVVPVKPMPAKPAITNAQMFAPLPFAGATLSFMEIALTNDKLPNLFGPNPPDAGTEYAVFTFVIKNTGDAPLVWEINTFDPNLTTKSGKTPVRGTALFTQDDKKFDGIIKPGDEKTVAFDFQIPKGDAPEVLTIRAESGPTYRFDVRPR